MKFVNNALVYLSSNILNALVPFILLPILTRNLTVAEYGQVAMFQILLYTFSSFIGLNTVSAANRRYFDKNVDTQDCIKYNSSCIHVLILSVIITLFILYFIDDYIASLSNIKVEWVYLALFSSAFLYLIKFRLSQWQIINKPIKYGVFQVSVSLLLLISSLYLVIVWGQGAFGRVFGQFLSLSLFGIFALFLLYKDRLISLFYFERGSFLESIKFGLPLVPHTVGFFLITYVDRIIINDELGIEKAGIYMVAFQLSSVLSFVFDAVNKSYTPWLFSKLKSNNQEDKLKIVKSTYVYFAILMFLAALFYYVVPFLVLIVAGNEYSDSAEICAVLVVGQIFGGMYLMVTNYIFYAKKTKYLSSVTISTGFLNILLVVIFIGQFGLMGAAMAFLSVKLLQFILTFIVAIKVYPFPWLLHRN